uniref:Putative secreted peptide n=1 Tax=Anopheles braziliensis TaxID=58242 RepID=A0A2M3ZXJ4_9DIPT
MGYALLLFVHSSAGARHDGRSFNEEHFNVLFLLVGYVFKKKRKLTTLTIYSVVLKEVYNLMSYRPLDV